MSDIQPGDLVRVVGGRVNPEAEHRTYLGAIYTCLAIEPPVWCACGKIHEGIRLAEFAPHNRYCIDGVRKLMRPDPEVARETTSEPTLVERVLSFFPSRNPPLQFDRMRRDQRERG